LLAATGARLTSARFAARCGRRDGTVRWRHEAKGAAVLGRAFRARGSWLARTTESPPFGSEAHRDEHKRVDEHAGVEGVPPPPVRSLAHRAPTRSDGGRVEAPEVPPAGLGRARRSSRRGSETSLLAAARLPTRHSDRPQLRRRRRPDRRFQHRRRLWAPMPLSHRLGQPIDEQVVIAQHPDQWVLDKLPRRPGREQRRALRLPRPDDRVTTSDRLLVTAVSVSEKISGHKNRESKLWGAEVRGYPPSSPECKTPPLYSHGFVERSLRRVERYKTSTRRACSLSRLHRHATGAQRDRRRVCRRRCRGHRTASTSPLRQGFVVRPCGVVCRGVVAGGGGSVARLSLACRTRCTAALSPFHPGRRGVTCHSRALQEHLEPPGCCIKTSYLTDVSA
jgi:hypothetical protein